MTESIASHTNSVSNFAAKLGRALSPNRTDSRGRTGGNDTVFQSSGRGGAGNIKRSSKSRDARPVDGPDDFSPARGRELANHPPNTNANGTFVSAGRGGAGNYRSPSRDPAQTRKELEQEKQVIEAAARRAEESGVLASSGRGGFGNIHRSSVDRSRSRSQSRGPSGDYSPTLSGVTRPELDKLEEEDRKLA
jgi:hypothetical protein